METIDRCNDFLKMLNIPEVEISKLYGHMKSSKSNINTLLGLTEECDYRRILDYSFTEETFIEVYPETYKWIKKLVGKNNSFSITENWIEGNKFPKRTKLSKFLMDVEITDYRLKKLLSELGRADISVIFDIVKPKNIVISTNMYDFLTSSSNAAFRSCYALNGSHFSGNISHILDNFTFMIFTYSKNVTRKIGRAWGFLPNDERADIFLTSKIYGSIYEREMVTAIKWISTKLNKDGDWKSMRMDYLKYENARPACDYPIPVYFDHTHILVNSYRKHITYDDLPTLKFSNTYCLNCGEDTNNGYYGMCNSCAENIVQCEYCSTVLNYKLSPTNSRICTECYEKYYKPCSICSTMSSDMACIDDKEICWSCIDRLYKECKICGDYHLIKESNVVNDKNICKKCIKFIVPCSKCGYQIFPTIFPLIHEGKQVCSHCYERAGMKANVDYNWNFTYEQYTGTLTAKRDNYRQIVKLGFYINDDAVIREEVSFSNIKSKYLELNETTMKEIAEIYITREIDRNKTREVPTQLSTSATIGYAHSSVTDFNGEMEQPTYDREIHVNPFEENELEIRVDVGVDVTETTAAPLRISDLHETYTRCDTRYYNEYNTSVIGVPPIICL